MKRWIYFLISTVLTISLVLLLNTRIGKIPALGVFMSPQHGFWQNAEPFNYNFNELHALKGLNGEVEVVFDERLVPHVYSENQEDAVFVQGYLHARFRLWQMEFQTHSAAGRISEVLGDVALEFDREQRRIGMVYGAEILLKEMESDPLTKSLCDAYTAGVNAYIKQLPASQLPIEYKLLGYNPEPWSNLKIALFVKAMSKRLAGYTQDLEFSAMRQLFSDAQMKILFPAMADSLQPIIPRGTKFPSASVIPVMPATADSLYLKSAQFPLIRETDPSNPEDGSNNWVVSGSKTKNGSPILCNDPHLDLSLPAIWYEMQMSGPNINVYGTSFPGIPGIVIGFNDHIAWGITNSERDMRDYYEIQFKDDSKKEYWFNGQWKKTQLRVEKIKVKDEFNFYDTVAYTVFGPVVYDRSFKSKLHPQRAIAMRWKTLDPSNEAKAFWLLNHAQNYNDFLGAIQYLKCPPQNLVFASKTGDIAIWQQGEMPARWNRQGAYIMPGTDSSYMWQGFIPQEENPHALNPEQGFLQSANQRPTDSTYPYFIPGYYDHYRAITIHKFLEGRQNITVDEMKKLQNENYNSFAATILPLLFRHLKRSQLDPLAQRYYWQLKSWNLKNDIYEKGPVLFSSWFDTLRQDVWGDELSEVKNIGLFPPDYVLAEALLKDTAFSYVDDVQTPQKETLSDLVTKSFLRIIPKIDSLSKAGKLEWGAFKNTTVYHLLKKAMLPFARTGLPIGGGRHIVNATQHSHGASWRMIIELGAETEAFVVYPGGQSGNPGSRYYDPFVNTWAEGKYYRAWVYKHGEADHPNLRWRMRFTSAK
jgi:penicillin amidase